MKKLIAICMVALAVLANVAPLVPVAEETENTFTGIQVAEDLEPRPNPYDNVVL